MSRKVHAATARPERQTRGRRRWSGKTGILVVAIGLGLGLGGIVLWRIHNGPTVLHKKPGLNVVLVSGDTLRADRLGCYGNRFVATPHLDRLAASGVLFENVTTVAPLTLPAHTSLFTGTYPMYHGIEDNGTYVEADQITLAEILKDQGYATGAFVGAFVLDSRWGLNQGFDRYFDNFDTSKYERNRLDQAQRPGGEVLEEALPWLDSVKQGPFFAWIHLYDPHAPYDPPEPYRTQYEGQPWGLYGRGGRYDGEVAYLDSVVGRLWSWLEREGLDETTLLAFIGDHGESLGEHGEGTHGFFIYGATTQVPFILVTPYREMRGRRVEAQVRIIDVMPTVLDLLGLDIPPHLQGVSLLSLASGQEEDLDLAAYSESRYPRNHYGWSELRSLRTSMFHFISAPHPELYDLRVDPLEEKNLAPQRPEAVRQFSAQIDEIVALHTDEGAEDKGSADLDPETQAQLAALGYVGWGTKVEIDSSHPLADPKDKVELFNLITEAGIDTGQGRLEAAIEKMRRVLDSDPGVLEAYFTLGNLYKKTGDLSKAIETFEGALVRDPDYVPSLFNLALINRDSGRLKEALVGIRRCLELNPRHQEALLILGQIYFDLADLDEAEAAFGRLLEINPRSAKAENNLGSVALSREELDEAEKHFLRAAEIDPELASVHFNLGSLYQKRNDLPRAEAEYREEVRLHPDHLAAHHNLGLLYLETGNVDGQLEAFQEVVRLDPSSARAHFLLADALFRKDRHREALPEAERAVSLDPTIEEAQLLLAAIHEALGNPEEAKRALARYHAVKG